MWLQTISYPVPKIRYVFIYLGAGCLGEKTVVTGYNYRCVEEAVVQGPLRIPVRIKAVAGNLEELKAIWDWPRWELAYKKPTMEFYYDGVVPRGNILRC